MNFIFFNVILLFAGFLAVLIFSIGFMACLAPMALLTKSKKPSYLVTFLLFGIVGIYQIYFWGLWSAFCVAMTIRFIHKPDVNWVWLYWISGFFWCISLIGWLVHKETQLSESTEEVRSVQKGATLYSLINIVAFLVFAFAPSLMIHPYGWAIKPLGLQTRIVSETTNMVKRDDKVSKSVEGFFTGYEYALNANELGREILSSKDITGDYEKMRSLLTKSKARLSECDITLLNKIYSGWGDIVSNKFIPAINLVLAGAQQHGDRNDLVKGDVLMADFDNWMQNNWNKLLLRLNQEYGYEIKK